MPSTAQGLLDSEDWDRLKSQFNEDWGDAKPGFNADWRPIDTHRRRRSTMSRVKSWVLPSSKPASQRRLHPTAYLDGLRGFAALLVYWHHHELWAHGHNGLNTLLENGFGYDGKYYTAALPGVRTLFTGGHYAVSTFFVISGYVLAIKPLSLLQSGNLIGLGDHLASALFRRWVRLFLPLFITIGLYAVSWHTFNLWVKGMNPQGNWRDELWSFYQEFKNFSFIFKEGGLPWMSYNFHLWSIPAEFRGSIVVYTSIMAFSRCSVKAHLWCQVGLIFYFMYVADGWFCAMFVSGMLIRHLDLLAERDELPSFLARLGPYKTFIYYHLFALSIYLGGVPCENQEVDQLAKSRGWYFLSKLKPQAVFDYKWFYLFWAATLLVAALPRIRWLKSFFELRACQYLGRVSYALYLVHGPLLWTVGDRIYAATGWHTQEHLDKIPHWVNKVPLPRSGPLGLEVSFLVPHLLLLPLTLLLAEVVTRAIDGPSVRFASWMYKQVSAEPVNHEKQARA